MPYSRGFSRTTRPRGGRCGERAASRCLLSRLQDAFGGTRLHQGGGRESDPPLELIAKLGLEQLLAKKSSHSRKEILAEFEAFGRQLRRQAFMDLVASFEHDLFRILRMGTSHARTVIDRNYDAYRAFYDARMHLVRTPEDFGNLGGYKGLLSEFGKLDEAYGILLAELNAIRSTTEPSNEPAKPRPTDAASTQEEPRAG